MRIFLINTENVHAHGLDGMEKLESTDMVYILSTKSLRSEKIEGDLLLKAVSSKASFCVEDLEPNGTKNYLDFQLCTILGRLMERYGSAEAIIISKDNGYIAAMDYWKKNNRTVAKAESILDYLEPTIIVADLADGPTKAVAVQKEKKTQAATKQLHPDDKESVEEYRKQIAEIIKQLFPDRKKATITKQSKATAKFQTKKELKNYCISSLGDDKTNCQLYSRICQIWPY